MPPIDEKKQFVIHEHTTPDGVHWDLMLEMDDCLWTWRLNTPPAEIKDEPIPAERIHDHPLRFLTYEGPVQNNAGQVTIADKGTYNVIPTGSLPNEIRPCVTHEPIKPAPQSGSSLPESLILQLHGNILNGTYTFRVACRTWFGIPANPKILPWAKSNRA